VAFYSEARGVVTEKTPFPYTPAQHAGLLHPLKSQGRVTVARILPEPIGWTEQCWEPWELEAVLVRAVLLRSPFRRGLEPERHGASLLNSFLRGSGSDEESTIAGHQNLMSACWHAPSHFSRPARILKIDWHEPPAWIQVSAYDALI
jgi:hypothetical protein